MIKKTKIKFADGTVKTQIRVVKGVRPAPKEKTKQVTIKSFGYLEDQKDLDAFWNKVNEVNNDMLEGKRKHIIIEVPMNAKNNDNYNKEFNYGYIFLESVLKMLGVKEFFDNIEFKGDYSLYDIFEFLTFQRILNPASKRMTYQEKDKFYNKKYEFQLHDIYRALDKFCENSIQLQAYLNEKIKTVIGRNKEYAFYDVTNFYYEKDFDGEKDSFLKKGVSKEKKLGPIVQFGMIIDSNQLPIAMKPFPGNTNDSTTLIPILKEVKKSSTTDRIILVADRGILSNANISYLTLNGDGYLISATIRGKKGLRYQEYIFDKNEWVGDDNFKHKEYTTEIEVDINTKKKAKVPQKVFVFYSKKEANYQKTKREVKLRKAIRNLNNNIYEVDKKFEKTDHYVASTGELADASSKSIDYEKYEEEAKLDGYFCIVTSEMNYSADEAIKVYRNLCHIEESFKIEKSDLETRPIYVTKNNHIEAHLLICYVSLLVLRLIQLKMSNEKISVSRMQKVLNKCNCILPNEVDVLLSCVAGKYEYQEIETEKSARYKALKLNEKSDEVRNDYIKIMKSFEIDIDYMYMDRAKFNKQVRRFKFDLKKK